VQGRVDDADGPHGGLGVLGWDAAKKVYTWSGFNNMGRAETATGTRAGSTWTFNGQNDIGGKAMKTRYTVRRDFADRVHVPVRGVHGRNDVDDRHRRKGHEEVVRLPLSSRGAQRRGAPF
jgi:hypothetical protein